MSALFNLYDYIFLSFILFFALIGLLRGFWTQFFATVIWLIGIVSYYSYAPIFEQGFLSQYMSTLIAHWFSIATVLIGCFFINFIIRFVLGCIFKINALTFFNKIGGLIFGAFASVLIVLLIIYAVDNSNLRSKSTDWSQSYLVSNIAPFMNSLEAHDDNKISFATTNTSVSQITDTEAVA